MYTTHIDGIKEQDWNILLDGFADANIYQTWAYGAVRWGEEQLSHLVLRRDGIPVAIAQLRVVRLPVFGSGIAYLRWGPICRRRDEAWDPAVLRAAGEALVQEYVFRRKLLLRVIPSTFQDDPECQEVESLWSGLGFHRDGAAGQYHTVRVDLRPSVDDLRRALNSKWRRDLNIAEKNGLEVREARTDDLFAVFVSLYREMLARKRFDTTVDVAEFERMQRRLPESQKLLVLICLSAGVPVAGLVLATVGKTSILQLAATGDSGMDTRGSFLLQWHAMRRLRESGHDWYDLGGINREKNPGVYMFKTRMGGIETAQLAAVQLSHTPLSRIVVALGEGVRGALTRVARGRRDR